MVSKDWEHLPPRWVTFHRKRVSLLFLDLDYVCYGRKMDCSPVAPIKFDLDILMVIIYLLLLLPLFLCILLYSIYMYV